MGTKVFMFHGNSYLGYDRGEDRLDEGYPLPIANNWPGLAEAGFDEIDAALNTGHGKVYFFRGGQYMRYDVVADRADDGYPQPIANNWPGIVEAGFVDGIDAALNLGNGKAYFFRGNQYVRYDLAADRVDDGYPLLIAGSWAGFTEAGFADRIDSAINWGSGTVFFFRDGQYLAYDMATERVVDGYPRPIAGNWPGLSEAGADANLRGVVDLFDDRNLWLPDAIVVASPVNGPKFLPMPWRGVLHTTEGASADGAISSFQQTNFWPHFTIEPRTLKVFQHLPLSIGARALSDHGTPQNAAHCIQIEIVGMAAASPQLPPEQLAFIRDVMRQIENLVPIPRRSDRTFLDAAGVNANPNNHMSIDEWKVFTGWCGHQHVPGATHWDPGAIDIQTLLNS